MTTQTRRVFLSRASATEANFEELYRAALPRIYNYFRYRAGDGQIAEDLTSETFEKAWRNRERYRHDLAAFSTWLFTIARRVAHSKMRPYLGYTLRRFGEVDYLPPTSIEQCLE